MKSLARVHLPLDAVQKDESPGRIKVSGGQRGRALKGVLVQVWRK